jgi:hypothetical protein
VRGCGARKDDPITTVASEPLPPKLRGMRNGAVRLVGLAIFLGGFALVLSVHPDRWSGWALWAVSPLLLYFLYLLAFRGPPQRLRLLVAGSVVSGYALTYGLAAGFGNESYKAIAQLVYLGLPTLGLLAIVACIPGIELAGAIASTRMEPSESQAPFQALPLRYALVGGVVVAAWAVLMLSGWPQPNITVADDFGGRPAAVADVRCAGEDTLLSTPSVVRQTDGIHVQVTNAGGNDIWLEYEIDNGSGGGGGELIEPGISARIIRHPASSIGFACTKHGDGTAAEHATAAVAPGHPR